MISGSETNPVTSFGVQNKKVFTITTNAKAFKVLYQSLYSDPIKAIIRELSTNARDSHIQAGTHNIPFIVNLPTWTSNLFSIRDFGTGMSREKIETVYSSFFCSDRENSNDFTGCLGLGAKAFLSYTKQATLNSFFNKKKYTYTIILNEDGIPELNFFGESDTTEPNGVEVSFCVESKDSNTFTTKCREVFQFFKVKPTVIGIGQNFIHYNPTYLYEEKDWKFRSDNSYASAMVTMGDIAYPLSNSLIKEELRGFCGLPLLIEFEIGDVDMTASREALEYTAKTIKAIENKLEIIKKSLTEKVQSKLTTIKGYFDTCCMLNTLREQAPYNKFFSLVNNNIKFPQFKQAIKTNGNIHDYLNKGNIFTQFSHGGKSRRYIESNFTFNPTSVYIVVNDTGNDRKGKSKVSYFSTGKNKVYYIFDEKGDYSQLAEVFDNPLNFIKVSQLPDPPPGFDNSVGYIKKIRGQVNTYRIKFNPSSVYSLDKTELNSDKPHRVDINQTDNEIIYGTLYRGHCSDISEYNLGLYMKALGCKIEVHCIKGVDLHKVDQKPGWIKVTDYIKRELLKKADSLNAAQYIAEAQSRAKLNYAWLWNMSKLDIQDLKHIYHDIKNKYDNLTTVGTAIQKIMDACEQMNVIIKPHANIQDIKVLEDNFVNKYTFVKCMDSVKAIKNPKIITETILAFDK